jgi:hypothetical protein
MIPVNETTKPVIINNDKNVECLIYIKYKWGDENCIPNKFIICPPEYADWKQLVTYLGYNLKPKEMDFIYGGSKYSVDTMLENLHNYFEDLKKDKIIEYYLFDVKENK